MIKSATAVKAKIKNKAGGNSDKSQIMLRIYLMERLLERRWSCFSNNEGAGYYGRPRVRRCSFHD